MWLKRNVNTDERVADAPRRYGVSWEKSTVERSSDVKGDCGRGGDGQERGRVALTPEGWGREQAERWTPGACQEQHSLLAERPVKFTKCDGKGGQTSPGPPKDICFLLRGL